jgi:MFS transporter, FHS family, glucose/mannose:H+ symporter
MNNIRIKLSLFLNYFVFAILLNSVGTVILQVQNNFGVLGAAAGRLEAYKDLSIAIVSFLMASYIVRIGYKKTMLFALGFITVVCLLVPSLPGFAVIKLLFAATGISFALIKISVFATLGIVTKDKKEHASLMNFLESFFMIGVLCGYFIFSYFINPDDKASTSWFNVYYLLGGLSLVAFLLLLSTPLDESKVKDAAPQKDANEFLNMLLLIGIPLVVVFIISAFFYVLIEQSIMSWLPTFNSKVLHLSSTLSVQMASILAGSIALGRFLAGIILRRIHWLAVLLACLVLAAAMVLLAIPLAQNVSAVTEIKTLSDVPLVAFIFPLIGLLLAPIYPAINSVILSSLPKQKHAPMAGLIVVFSALGGTFGSMVTGYIFEHYGGEKAFYFSLGPMAILVVALVMLNRLQKTNEAKIVFKATPH